MTNDMSQPEPTAPAAAPGINPPATPFPHYTVPQLFEQQAARTPDAVAVQHGEAQLSYAALDARANQLAHRLIALGVTRNTPVAMLLERGLDMVVTLLGIQKAGGYYVPLDPEYPLDRIAFLLADCAAKVLVTSADTAAHVEAQALPTVNFSLDRAALDALPSTSPDVALTHEDFIYAIYTSGSTGQPKGTLLFQRGAVNLYHWYGQTFGMGAHTRFIVLSSIGHDITQKGIFGPLLHGGCVVLLASTRYDAGLIVETIARQQITSISLVPTALYGLIDDADEATYRKLTSLTHVFPGGEGLEPKRLRAWQRQAHCRCQVINTYGPTETTDLTTWHPVRDAELDGEGILPIGRAIANTRLYVLDEHLQAVPTGQVGELCISGALMGGGYSGQAALTAQKFVENPYEPGVVMYRSGDLVTAGDDGVLRYLSRVDHQIKLRGYRIELPEIEQALSSHPAVVQAVVVVRQHPDGESYLAAYLRLSAVGVAPVADLRAHLLQRLPDYMLPSTWTVLEHFPLNAANKVDRHALPAPAFTRPTLSVAEVAPQNALQQQLAHWVQEALRLDSVGIHDPFFELGGSSLQAIQLIAKLSRQIGQRVPMVAFFAAPTVAGLASYLQTHQAAAVERWTGLIPTPNSAAQASPQPAPPRTSGRDDIAIVGMACRYPGADDLPAFWQLLRTGGDGLTTANDEQLLAAGLSDAAMGNPLLVRRHGTAAGVDCFDHQFFGYSPREAQLMDPQQRLLLETATAAIEHAGLARHTGPQPMGVFMAVARNAYYALNVASHSALRSNTLDFQTILGSDKDYAATRIAFKLNLSGPAVSTQAACASSGVGLHMACLSLRENDCDAAVIGGAAVQLPLGAGYAHLPGGPLAPDGVIRPFDADAAGMVLTSGAGCVVLKRLADAQADGDTIYAVIRATAVNNDAAQGKAAFTAPSVDGQAAVIASALAKCDVHPDSIGYIEAHGTGTALGDPIEVAALTQAWRQHTQQNQHCALGSVKANIGHLDAGAAVAGLIKTALSLHHRTLLATPNYRQPNPECGFETTPFYVSSETRDWPANADTPRRAALSSFGFGGTNFHAVLEEAPPRTTRDSTRPWSVLRMSAKTSEALAAQTAQLDANLSATAPSLADAAYTLDVGRARFAKRAIRVAGSAASSAEWITGSPSSTTPSLVFLFPGQGAQHVDMGKALYECEPLFRAEVDHCAAILQPALGLDLRSLLYPTAERREEAAAQLRATQLAQPAIFTISYATARLWQSWGLSPAAMIGHSVGEYVAATLAGVFELEHALLILAERARLMQSMPSGGMLAVKLGEVEATAYAVDGIALAAVNAPQLCVLSGPLEALAALRARLTGEGVGVFDLHTSHAFHSSMMEPVVPAFTRIVGQYPLSAPRQPFYSSLTGALITDAQSQDPAYWAQQLRNAVRFAPALLHCTGTAGRVLLEVGPGQNLTTSARQTIRPEAQAQTIASLPHANDTAADSAQHLTQALGRLWLAGIEADPRRYYAGETRCKIGLPGTVFARTRHWLDAATTSATAVEAAETKSAPPVTPNPVAPVAASTEASKPLVAAESAIRSRLRSLLEEHSGVDFSKDHDDTPFVELGLDSLTLTMVVGDVESEFGVKVSFRSLMTDARNFARLAKDIEARVGVPSVPLSVVRETSSESVTAEVPTAAAAGEHPPVHGAVRSDAQLDLWRVRDPQRAETWMTVQGDDLLPARVESPAPETPQDFSAAQQELWLALRFNPEVTLAYNMVSVLTLEGPLNRPALRWAWRALLARHPLLRARVDAEASCWQVPAWCETPLPIEDLSALDPSRQVAAMSAAEHWEANTPFDLETELPIRARVLVLDGFTTELVFNVHHMVCDGWSGAVLLKDFSRLYSYAVGAGPALAALTNSASDYCTAESAFFASETYTQRRAYWLEKLASPPPVLEWPLSQTRPARRQFEAARVVHRLDADLTRGLRKLAGQTGGSLLSVLLAGFSALTQRLTGNADQVVGLTTAGQVFHQQNHLVSHCVNLLPLRLSVAADGSFSSHASQTADAVMDAMEHQGLTYGPLLSELKLPRDDSRPALIAAIFNLDVRNDDIRFAGLEWNLRTVPHVRENFELFFNVVDRGQEVLIQLAYNSVLYSAEAITRRLGEYEVLMREAVVAADTQLAQLPLLTAEIREQIVERFNPLNTRFPPESLHECVTKALLRAPDVVAVRFAAQAMRNGELDARANAIATALVAQGVQPGDFVALCMDRGIDLPAALLGILKAGAAYLPIDPEFPPDRISYMLADSGSRVLLTQATVLERLKDITCPTLTLDTLPAEGTFIAVPRAADDPVHVIYTSGSTGKPKGVVVSHGNVLNLLNSIASTPGLRAGETLLAVTTVSFDIAGLELWLPLTVGATVVIASRDEALDSSKLAELMEVHQVDVFQATPATWRMLANSEWQGRASLRGFTGGEPLSRDLAAALLPKLGQLWNLYGPTETTIYSTGCRIENAEALITVGRPIANTRCHILDSRLQPVPVDVAGELYIGGAGVALGYHQRPELTAERFIPDPFGAEGKARLYRTGDLARWTADGRIEHLGRIDFQVKLRGYRIELGEIEAAIVEHSTIAECVVKLAERSLGDLRMVAYVVPKPTEFYSSSELRQHLRGLLPNYMVPNSFIELAALPRLPNGKLNRNALPNPFEQVSVQAKTLPQTATEKQVAAIWAELLKIDSVGVDDRFFDLGGHSLLAVQTAARLNQHFGIKLELRFLMMDPLRLVAAELDSRLPPRHEQAAVSASETSDPQGVEKPASASAQPKRGWVHRLLGGGS
ncbi:MAG: amino acid adenylation domain-containing protein [Stagnimonas sp.]|nr:amino acid adenylation domain-containing protein [Stagnimonas sp.]